MATEIVPAESQALGIPGRISLVGLELPETLTIEEWLEGWQCLKTLQCGVMWWVGDYLCQGERKYGEAYAQALDATDYEYQTLNDAVWVSSKVEFSRRRENLSWSHHKEVAALEVGEQEEWLRRAEAEHITRNALREAIRDQKRQRRAAEVRAAAKELPPAVVVLEADCLEWLPQHPAEFDCLIADPPYNTGRMEWDTFPTDEDFLAFTEAWLTAAFASIQPGATGFVFCPSRYQADFELILRRIGQKPKSRIVWHYPGLPLGRVVSDKLIGTHDVIFHCGDRPLHLWEEWDSRRFDVQTFAAPLTTTGDEKFHQVQKPLDLISWLVELGSSFGERVIDPFGGAGTTGAACLELGRSCVLLEKNPEFAAIARGRLSLGRLPE